MYTVYKKDSCIFQSGFTSWEDANTYGLHFFGPKNYEIIDEGY